jgi:hypothetical protein
MKNTKPPKGGFIFSPGGCARKQALIIITLMLIAVCAHLYYIE